MESGSVRADPRSLTRIEEAVKRNTDCVYFLASPLTCKKGSECDYRHSEGVRVNPRDCKFWFSGNCLNPKCLFRHPPLDGPGGNHVVASGTINAASQVTASIQLPTMSSPAYNFSRNSVPCYYFQNGTCLKGDKCPFMHRSQPISNHVGKQIAKAFVLGPTKLETPKEVALSLDECNSQQKLSLAPISCKESYGKPVYGGGLSSLAEKSMTFKSVNTHLSGLHSVPAIKHGHHIKVWEAGQSAEHCLKEKEAGEIVEGASVAKLKTTLNHQFRSNWHQNDNGDEEILSEFTSGFNTVKDPSYLHEKDDFRGQSGRLMNKGNGYGHQHSVAWVDRDRRNGASKLNYEEERGAGDKDRDSSFSVPERSMDKSILPARRLAHRLRSPDGMDESDLRHKLAKHRRLNSSFSATISGHESSNMQDGHAFKAHKDEQLLPESVSRLRGRIELPKPSSESLTDFHTKDSRKQKNISSSLRSSNLHGRLGDRSSARQVEDSYENQPKARPAVDPLDFAGPRSLAELKSAKAEEVSKSIFRNGKKSLDTLLKTNKEIRSGNDANPSFSNNKEAICEAKPCTFDTDLVSKENILEDAKAVAINSEEITIETAVEVETEFHIPPEVQQRTFEGDETEAGYAVNEELDYTNQKDGELDYKSEDEDMDLMNIDEEDEEEDDFAKKIGLIFS